MEQEWRTTAEALTALEAVMSSIDHDARVRLSAPERLVLMKRARSFRDRAVSLACVLTDEASHSSVAATGTPITSLIGLEEGRDSGDAARQVFQARDLARHKAVKEAALAGKVSSRHAAAIGKGMAQLPSELTTEQQARAEQAFLDRANKNTPKRLAELAPQILAEVAPELVPTVDDEAARLEQQRRRAFSKRSLRWGDDGDGSTWLHGSLPHLEAAPLISLIEAYVESDRRAARDRFRATRATDPGPQVTRDQAAEDINRTPEQRRADALTQIISDHRDAPTSVGDRPRIVVTIREQDLRERAERAGVLARGARITAGDLRRLCCDADLMPVVLGGPSEILDVGRTQRLVTPAIRKALSLRDGGCVFPQCSAPDSACEAHHLQPWWAGGATALWNLVLLCPHHHQLVEPDRWSRPEDRWVIHIDPDTARVVVVPPARTNRFTARAGPPSSSAGTSPSDSAASAGLRRMAEPGAPPLIHSLA
ncbi:HNH endonuclease signature motif containing protein [Tessaracoccus antarcticus]|uniref:HNH endonuclease n=1 Tax=Tessaracoccus antarcticus TaxID=2479848 RepID=A0A3M0G2H0_9ACTN|nr:HNH endonuclease signature motif containing protein [Tessaracoccus antarcticus]RMB58768.1 HNH endonuclease [Tessaracoccus antarcticus]